MSALTALGPAPWQQICHGFTWAHMPGDDEFSKKCLFALFRRGLLTKGDVAYAHDTPLRTRVLEASHDRSLRLRALRDARRAHGND